MSLSYIHVAELEPHILPSVLYPLFWEYYNEPVSEQNAILCFWQIWLDSLGAGFVFFVSLTCFPALASAIVSTLDVSSVWKGLYWFMNNNTCTCALEEIFLLYILYTVDS